MYRKIYESKGIIYRIIEWIFPENLNCILCDLPISRENKYSLCKTCYEKLIFLKTSCYTCGKPSVNKNVEAENSLKNFDVCRCEFCTKKNFLFDRNISFLEYDDLSSKFVFGLKYSMRTYLAKIISEIMYDTVCNLHSNVIRDIDYILYVPLSKERMKERGFNQSEKIAFYFSNLSGITYLNALERIKDTKRLFNLNKLDRTKEVKKAFLVKEDYRNILEGSNVILIDDIFTTGTTVNEISKVLKLSGVKNIIILSFLTGKYKV